MRDIVISAIPSLVLGYELLPFQWLKIALIIYLTPNVFI